MANKNGNSGVMVALKIPPEIARQIAVSGGEPEEELHLTICYIPGASDDAIGKMMLQEEIAKISSVIGPIVGCISGIGVFNGSEPAGFKDVFYASVSCPGLEKLRAAVLKAVEACGLTPSSRHGFTPHVTLKYLERGESAPDLRFYLPTFPMTQLVIGTRTKGTTEFQMNGTVILKSQPTSSQVHVPTAGSEKKAPNQKLPPHLSGSQRSREVEPPRVDNLEAEIMKAVLAPDPSTADDAGSFPLDQQMSMSAFQSLWESMNEGVEKELDNEGWDGTQDMSGEMAEQMEVDQELLGEEELVDKADLTPKGRDEIKDSNFALPGRKYPIHDESHARNALSRVAQHGTEEEQAKVRAAVKRKFPNIGKSKAKKKVNKAERIEKIFEETRLAKIAKANNRKQVVHCVVLEPDSVDSQGDWLTHDDIEDAAHVYMQKSRVIGSNHKQPIDASPVESFIAPQDLQWEGGPNGPQIVKKGSWVLGIKVHDVKEWKKVEAGDYGGVSVGGMGLRT